MPWQKYRFLRINGLDAYLADPSDLYSVRNTSSSSCLPLPPHAILVLQEQCIEDTHSPELRGGSNMGFSLCPIFCFILFYCLETKILTTLKMGHTLDHIHSCPSPIIFSGPSNLSSYFLLRWSI